MNTTRTAPANPFALITELPADFRETHRVETRFPTMRTATRYLDRMHAACADSAAAHLSVYEATGDTALLVLVGKYLAVCEAVAARRVAA